MGDWTATFPLARAALAAARRELRDAGGKRLALRQAAEKGWLALAMATDAGMIRLKDKPVGRTSFAAWKKLGGEDAMDEANAIRAVLHGECFYSNGGKTGPPGPDEDACRPDILKRQFKRVDRLIDLFEQATKR